MTSIRAYEQYAHTIRLTYHSLGVANLFEEGSLLIPKYEDLAGRSREDVAMIACEAMSARLSLLGADTKDQLFTKPYFRPMSFSGREYVIPILNTEGHDWYYNSPVFNFDFLVENFVGLHNNAKVIYDLGGHQGVWALYYSSIVGEDGRVHSFEPSAFNVECAALSYLINDISNVFVRAAGVGPYHATYRPTEEGLLIGGITHNVNILTMSEVFWEKPDFVKVDIEGYEYDLLKAFPLFEFCRNVHLELHVPHLIRRNLDYREIYDLIPFDRVRVQLHSGHGLIELTQADELEGYCSLMITPK